jgi:hypothetical protein
LKNTKGYALIKEEVFIKVFLMKIFKKRKKENFLETGALRKLESIKYFGEIQTKTYQLLGYLGYNKEEEISFQPGKWIIYTKRNFTFPYFYSEYKTPVNKFVAIYAGNNKNTVVYGSFQENLREIKNALKEITEKFFAHPKKLFRIPLTLNEENAQDYGYARGLILGLFLLIADIGFSWIFKLKSGIFIGLVDFIGLVYYMNPSLAVGIGLTGTGLYFGFLLVFIPILYGNICVKRAEKLLKRKLKTLSPEILNYEFGIHAEQSLEEELSIIIEEKKKEKIYEEFKKISPKIKKDTFEKLYRDINHGFFSPESLQIFLKEYQQYTDKPLENFLEIVNKYQKARVNTEIHLETT